MNSSGAPDYILRPKADPAALKLEPADQSRASAGDESGAILKVGLMEVVVGPTSLGAITLAQNPHRYRSGFIALRS